MNSSQYLNAWNRRIETEDVDYERGVESRRYKIRCAEPRWLDVLRLAEAVTRSVWRFG